MKDKLSVALTAALVSLFLVVGVGPANASTYWISPYFSDEINNYLLSGCKINTDIWELHHIKAYENGGDTSGDIGMRTEYIDGYSVGLTWKSASVTIRREWTSVFPWTSSRKLDRYKVYHY